MVHAGETVKKGDALMKLSGESISSAAKELENKIKNPGRPGEGSGKPESVDNQKQASEQSWAENFMRLLRRAEMFLWIMPGRR